ncbi:zinc ribbon domain-containing protein [Enemella sp. A6]|uniref:zinc ribbon domain-containing protein n=1 Tax=Enemella sp. A6 TaxID=3440152 RepID=UPI003EC06B85
MDSSIAQTNHRKATLPELARAAELKRRVGELDDRLIAADTAIADLEVAQARAESDLVPVRQRREREQQRIDSGSVTDGNTLSNLITEVEQLGKRISDLEDAELEVMEKLETAQAEREELRAERAEAHTELTEVVTRGRAAMAELNQQLGQAQTRREAVAAELPDDLLQRYQRIGAKHGGVGAAALVRRRCTGCQLDLNAAEVARFAEAHVDEVLICEQCGRIVVRTEESGL